MAKKSLESRIFHVIFLFYEEKKIAKLQNLTTQKNTSTTTMCIILVGIRDSLDSICRALNGSARTDHIITLSSTQSPKHDFGRIDLMGGK
jgi:hypothetical protein